MSTISPGARRSMPKITIDMPSRVRRPMPSRWAMYVFTGSGGLLVPPHVGHAAEVVDVVVRHHPLHVRPHREVVEAPIEQRPRRVRLHLLLERGHERQALLRVQLLGLLLDHLHHFLAAVLAIVPRRAARVV